MLTPSPGFDLTPECLAYESSITLYRVAQQYTRRMSRFWLYFQLCDLADKTGLWETTTPQRIQDMAIALEAEYGFLTLNQWMVFFSQVKSGKWGEFYGKMDSTKIGAKLGEYIKWMRQQMDIIERNKESQLRAIQLQQEQEEAVTWEEYQRIKDQS